MQVPLRSGLGFALPEGFGSDGDYDDGGDGGLFTSIFKAVPSIINSFTNTSRRAPMYSPQQMQPQYLSVVQQSAGLDRQDYMMLALALLAGIVIAKL